MALDGMHALARVLVLCLSSSLVSGCDAKEGEGTNESGETTDTDGGLTPAEEFEALCEQQNSREACAAVPAENDNEHSEAQWCAWVVEVPAQLEGEVCIFGTPTSECRRSSAGEIGCHAGGLGSCGILELGWSRMDQGTLLVGRGGLCEPPTETTCGVTPEADVVGAPECACLCDPGFPL